jgi:hypothetical protein
MSRESATRRETPWYKKYTKNFHSNLSVAPFSVNVAPKNVTVSMVSNVGGLRSGALSHPPDNILAAEAVREDWKRFSVSTLRVSQRILLGFARAAETADRSPRVKAGLFSVRK